MSCKIYDALHVYFIYFFFGYFFSVEERLKDKIRFVACKQCGSKIKRNGFLIKLDYRHKVRKHKVRKQLPAFESMR